MKISRLLLAWLTVFIMLSAGCESGSDKIVTGDFFDRKPGDLKSISTGFSSITAYEENTGEGTYVFAGVYENVSAFSVFKFPQPSRDISDSLESATVKFDVSETWKNGSAEFGLFETVSDWSDSVRLDKDFFLSGLGSPVSVFSDTSSSLGSLDFKLSLEAIDYIRSWNGPGSFLVKNTDEGESIVGISSNYSNYKPSIEYVVRKAAGAVDTTTTNCILSNYYFETGFDPDNYSSEMTGLVSDADQRGFVLKVAMPDSLPPAAAIIKCIIKMKILDFLAPSFDAFYVGFYQLTDSLTTLSGAQYESVNVTELAVSDDLSSLEIDITTHIHSWHKNKDINYGILVKPLQNNSSPNQVVLAPDDSLTIIYTSMPEVK